MVGFKLFGVVTKTRVVTLDFKRAKSQLPGSSCPCPLRSCLRGPQCWSGLNKTCAGQAEARQVGCQPAWLNRTRCPWLSGSQARCHRNGRAVVCQPSAWVSIQGLVLFNTIIQCYPGSGCRSGFAEDAEVGGAVGSREKRPCRGI